MGRISSRDQGNGMMQNSLKPLNDLIVIRRIIEEEPRTPMGILLPPSEENAQTPYRGTVVAVGPGKPSKLSGAGSEVVESLKAIVDAHLALPPVRPDSPRSIPPVLVSRAIEALLEHKPFPRRVMMTVKTGDTVVFSRNGFQEMKYNGETLIVLGEASIIGIIE